MMYQGPPVLSKICLSLALTCSATQSEELLLTDGSFSAQFSQIASSSEVRFISPDGELQTVPSERLIRFGNEPVVDITSGLVMVDGSLLIGRINKISKDSISIVSRHFANAVIPLRFVRGIALHLPTNLAASAKLLDQIEAATGEDDQLLMVNGDQVLGVIDLTNSLADALPAMRSDWRIERGRKVQAFAASMIRAVILSPRLHPMEPPTGFWFGLDDGSRLAIRAIGENGDETIVKSTAGLSFTSPVKRTSFLKCIRVIEPIHTIESMLSQLIPAAYKQSTTISSLTWPLGLNRGSGGEPIVVQGTRYRHGVAMRAGAQAIFKISKDAERFAADLAVMPASPRVSGSVVFEVFSVDAAKAVHPRFRSDVVKGGDSPLPIDIPLEDDVLLMLVVRDAGDGCSGDHAVWIDARFVASVE